MKLYDAIKLSLINVKRNKNRIYIALIIIMTILSMGVICFKNTINKTLRMTLNNEIGYRDLVVYYRCDVSDGACLPTPQSEAEDINEILKIKHVLDAYPASQSYIHLKINIDNIVDNGNIMVLRGTKKTLPTIVEGRAFSDDEDGVIICPKHFYPGYNGSFDKKKGIDGKKILGKTMNASYYEEDSSSDLNSKQKLHKKFKVIGLYDVSERMNEVNTCYISPKDTKSIDEIINPWVEQVIPEEGAYMTSIESISAIVDDVENVPYVLEKLTENNFANSHVSAYIDYEILNRYKISFIVAFILILLATTLIASSYLKKKIVKEKEDLAILMSLGYTKKDIIKCFTTEVILTSFFAYIIGMILFIIIYQVCVSNIKYLFFASYTIGGIPIGYDSFLITFILIIFVPIIISLFNIDKICKVPVSNILGSDTK